MNNDDVDIPPMDGEAEEMSFRKENGHKPRNAYDGEIDKIQETLAALYQENAQYGNFVVEVKRFYPEEGKWKTCGYLNDLSIESVPSPDWVGRKFGGGSFRLICRFKGAKGVSLTKSFTIDLAESYDAFAEKAGNKPLSAQTTKADGICAADPLAAIKGVAELSRIAGVGTRQESNPLLEALLKNQTEIQTAILQSAKGNQDGKVSEAVEVAKTMAELAKPNGSGELIPLLINQMQVQAKEQQQNMLAFLQAQAQQSQQMTQMMVGLFSAMFQNSNAQKETTADKMLAAFIPKLLEKPSESASDKLLAGIIPKMLESGKKENSFDGIERIMDITDRLALKAAPQSEEDRTTEKIINMILEWSPKLLKSTVDAITVRNMIKTFANEEYKQLMSNPQMQEKVVEVLSDKMPAEQVQTIAKTIGINPNFAESADSPKPPQETQTEAKENEGVVLL